MEYPAYISALSKLAFYCLLFYLAGKTFLSLYRVSLSEKQHSANRAAEREDIKENISKILEDIGDEVELDEIDKESLEDLIDHNMDAKDSRHRIIRKSVLNYLEEHDKVSVLEFSPTIYHGEKDVVSFFSQMENEFCLKGDLTVEVEEVKSFNISKHALESLQSHSDNKSLPKFRVEIEASKKHEFEIYGEFPRPDLTSELNKILEDEGCEKRIYSGNYVLKNILGFNKTIFLILEQDTADILQKRFPNLLHNH